MKTSTLPSGVFFTLAVSQFLAWSTSRSSALIVEKSVAGLDGSFSGLSQEKYPAGSALAKPMTHFVERLARVRTGLSILDRALRNAPIARPFTPDGHHSMSARRIRHTANSCCLVDDPVGWAFRAASRRSSGMGLTALVTLGMKGGGVCCTGLRLTRQDRRHQDVRMRCCMSMTISFRPKEARPSASWDSRVVASRRSSDFSIG